MEFKLKYTELKSKLKEKLENVYTIIGDDEFLIASAIKSIKKHSIDQMPELNFDAFDQENFDCDAIINKALQLPFLSQKRCLVVSLPDKLKKDDNEKFSKYTKQPNADTVLIFVDRTSASKFGEVIDCSKLSQTELVKIVPNFFAKYGKSITLDAAQLLMERCNFDAQRVCNEAEKLSNYCNDQIVRKDDVNLLVKADLQFEVFKLTNYICEKNKQQTIKQINALVESKEDPLGIITLLSNTFRRMFYAKISNLTPQELATKMGVKPFAISKAKENANAFSQKELKKILELCEELDFMTKQGQMSPVNSLYYLVFSIFSNSYN